MNDTAPFVIYRAPDNALYPARTYTAVWFEELREWRIHLTHQDSGGELWSTSGWDTRQQVMLAFENSKITYSEIAPE